MFAYLLNFPGIEPLTNGHIQVKPFLDGPKRLSRRSFVVCNTMRTYDMNAFPYGNALDSQWWPAP
jgi:hypothetical protein